MWIRHHRHKAAKHLEVARRQRYEGKDLRLESSLGFTAFLTLGYAIIETRRPGGASTTFSAQGQTVAVGADAAFALPAFYEALE